eukprot:scaffold10108_cov117-Isochrysis_galbana.AAC.4
MIASASSLKLKSFVERRTHTRGKTLQSLPEPSSTSIGNLACAAAASCQSTDFPPLTAKAIAGLFSFSLSPRGPPFCSPDSSRETFISICRPRRTPVCQAEFRPAVQPTK